jgi:hypothetical protein
VNNKRVVEALMQFIGDIFMVENLFLEKTFQNYFETLKLQQ